MKKSWTAALTGLILLTTFVCTIVWAKDEKVNQNDYEYAICYLAYKQDKEQDGIYSKTYEGYAVIYEDGKTMSLGTIPKSKNQHIQLYLTIMEVINQMEARGYELSTDLKIQHLPEIQAPDLLFRKLKE